MKKFGFFRKARKVDNSGYPRPVYTITKTSANANAVIFNISTNLTNGQTLYWDITGAVAAEFTDSNGISNSIVLPANGNATITKVINPSPYTANGTVYANTNFTFTVRAGSADADVVGSNTAIIVTGADVSMIATGGTETIDGNYKYHTFNSNGTFTITNTGKRSSPANAPAQYNLLMVGGGGGGGTAFRGGHGSAGHVRDELFNASTGTANVVIGTSAANANGTITSFGATESASGGGRGGYYAGGIKYDGVNGGGGISIAPAPNTSNGSVGPNGTSGSAGGYTLSMGTRGGGGAGANTSAPSDVNVPSTFGNGGNGYVWYDGIEYGKGGGLNTTIVANRGHGGKGGGYPGGPGDSTPLAGSSGIVKIRYNYNTVPNRTIN